MDFTVSHTVKFDFQCFDVGHDLISELTWSLLDATAVHWLCKMYNVCRVEDFKTLSALPDLQKHSKRFVKYFDLHFYNNPLDDPPEHCGIDLVQALNQKLPNLITATRLLLDKFDQEYLSFAELAYLVHLLADLHQPFHGILW